MTTNTASAYVRSVVSAATSGLLIVLFEYQYAPDLYTRRFQLLRLPEAISLGWLSMLAAFALYYAIFLIPTSKFTKMKSETELSFVGGLCGMFYGGGGHTFDSISNLIVFVLAMIAGAIGGFVFSKITKSDNNTMQRSDKSPAN